MELVSASHGVLDPVLTKLTALLAQDYGPLKGVRREISSLGSELNSMHAGLVEYTNLENPNVHVKTWISLVRELAYDTELCIDKFIHRLRNGEHHGNFKELFRKTARTLKTHGSRSRIVDQINELKARIKELKELKYRCKQDVTPSSTSSRAAVDPRLCALFAEEAHLVGVDGPRDDLVKWMVDEESGPTKHSKAFLDEETVHKMILPRVLSIVGFGGLGKTTLAIEVYRKIQGHFDCWAFVSVSQKPDFKKIIKDVIAQVTCKDKFIEDANDWDEKRSIEKLREILHDKRYIVIIDDIWSTYAWNTIKCAFPKNNCSSRIIVTTRIVSVARSCCPNGDDRVYEMKALSDLHSTKLFLKRIFGSEDCCPDMLKQISNEILKNCEGLPLAIISVSGLLANKPTSKEEWEKVKRSIGSALEKNRSLEGMYSILSLSYNDLSPNLKTCLLYLSIFPEDYVIDRDRLVRLWIAEGFISKWRGQRLQEVAECNFYDLIDKSMIQPVDIAYDGTIRSCRVHGMMLEFIISKSVEDNFITPVRRGQMSSANRHVIRRLSVHHIDEELASVLANEDLSYVRSLTVTTSSGIEHLPSLARFEALRVLDLEGLQCVKEEDLLRICKMLFLQYLSLRNTGVSKLPPEIKELQLLSTLDISHTSMCEPPSQVCELSRLRKLDLRSIRVRRLPEQIWKLPHLEYLLVGGAGVSRGEIIPEIPEGIGCLRSLRSLATVDLTQCSPSLVEALGSIGSLEVLAITWSFHQCTDRRFQQALCSAIMKWIKLKSLTIHCGLGCCMDFLHCLPGRYRILQIFKVTGGRFARVPEWFGMSFDLTYVEITVCTLEPEHLKIIRDVLSLRYLVLGLHFLPEAAIVIDGFGLAFRRLERLSVCCRVPWLTFTKGAMPALTYLELKVAGSPASQQSVPSGISNLSSLSEVAIRYHENYINSPSVEMTVEAVKKEIADHKLINLVINGHRRRRGGCSGICGIQRGQP